MVFDQSFFDAETVKAVCYPIKAVGPKDPDTDETDDSYMVKWQELEYKMCDYGKQFQTRFSTVLYPHGAISLWEREALIQCLREHDTVFFGDDVKMGLWLTENNFEMRMDHRYKIDTEAPISFPTLYQQRGKSSRMFRSGKADRLYRNKCDSPHMTIKKYGVGTWASTC